MTRDVKMVSGSITRNYRFRVEKSASNNFSRAVLALPVLEVALVEVALILYNNVIMLSHQMISSAEFPFHRRAFTNGLSEHPSLKLMPYLFFPNNNSRTFAVTAFPRTHLTVYASVLLDI